MRRGITALACVVLFTSSALAAPLDDRFSYQGRLTTAGAPYTGTADLVFRLFDAAEGGAQIGADTVWESVPVSDGLFNVPLDFGVAAFDGSMRWLEIEARTPSGVGSYVNLGRQEILGTPYSIQTRGLFVDDQLRVGIGTTNPLAPVHVGGAGASLLVNNQSQPVSVLLNGTGIGAPLQLTHSGGGLGLEVYPSSQGFILSTNNVSTGVSASFFGTSFTTDDGFLQLHARGGTATAKLWADNDFNVANGSSGSLQLGSESGQGGIISLLNDNSVQTLRATGGLPGEPAHIALYDAVTSNQTVSLVGGTASGSQGGTIDTLSENGLQQFVVEPDIQGEGAFLWIARNDLEVGLVYDGNADFNQDPLLILLGGFRGMVFDTTVPADDSVILPGESIDAVEILDEPGIATNTSATTTALTGGYDTVLTRSITCPTAGFCIVIASGTAEITHANGTTSLVTLGVSRVPGSLPADQFDNDVQIDASNPSGFSSFPTTVHGVFSATPGDNTFYFIAKKWSGIGSGVTDPHLTVMFVPTGYGIVVVDGKSARGDKAAPSPTIAPMTFGEIKAEQAASFAAELARRDAELAEYQIQFEEIRARLEAVEREQGIHDRPPPASPPASGSKAAR